METLEKKENELISEKQIVNSSFDLKISTINNIVEVENHEIYAQKLVFTITKRLIDIILSVILLLITLPLIILFGLLIKLESKGPVFYSQERLGTNDRIFSIYKLRSMYSDAEKNGAMWAKVNDERVTKIGLFIRKTRIDELPQLYNVIKGEMSLIGPRPERKVFADEFIQLNNEFSKRTAVKPGLTGLAQVHGGYDLTPFEKLDLDLKYIKKRNSKMEFHIFCYTIKVIITGEGAR
ncbi:MULTISPECIES: sugar transferase [Exiguobacterium]|uniref:Sugar transferase n=1 Tax=Exiguobacterium acetylicum TaxID=41170 RepID=A0ABX8G9D3_EXIAC|nr:MULTISPECIES: sugar transferase [Exiguobacterium]KNH34767.1 UDP-phosphate N-acetylgalactosaminyl-1-phosphate transferase [Exiguobacterium acetylicum]QWB29745.1 sugar transferase [Exiguobacterium acetylicum]